MTMGTVINTAIIASAGEALKATLPPVHGRLIADAALAKLSWFRTGGTADLLFEPSGEADLVGLLRALPFEVPITVIGVGSNLLVRDGGVRGVVIRLGRNFAKISVRGTMVRAGAGAMDVHVAREAQKAGVAGLEFLVGIPGTIGGGLSMNAGAYGRDMANIFTHARAVDRFGSIHELDMSYMDFSYRKTAVPHDWILLCGHFEGKLDDPGAITGRMDRIMSERKDSQPIGSRTGGSTFKNPDPLVSAGRSAWQLVDEAGCRGMSIGGAQVSEKHCNFLINHGGATARDIEELGEIVRKKVKKITGITLEWEIKLIGEEG